MVTAAAVRLADLADHKRRVAALDVIRPKHPDDTNKPLRVGKDSRGRYWQFVWSNGKWVEFKRCPEEHLEAIFAAYGNSRDECLIEHRPGPSGCEMLYMTVER